MPRPFVFPDPDDRSKNDPSVIASSQQVLGLYNQENDEEEMQRVTKKVQDWFIERAKQEGWDEASFSGNQCILKNTFKK